ncbi:MAG: hypothetical protein IT452_11340 [Planctomycetia bacterium]|nr:hypothetical protein [Planctomycetia bacterium]
MNKAGLAGAALGAIALLLSIVNISRVSSALQRMEEAGTAPNPEAGTGGSRGPALSDEDRKAEVEYLKREAARISDEIKKARAEIAAGNGGTSVKPDPDGKTPLPLTAADVGAVIDSILDQRWRDQKLREADAKITMLERGAEAQLASANSQLKLDDAQKAKMQAVLKTQVDGYAEILRTLPVPDDKQQRLDKVTQAADEEIKKILSAQQYQMFQGSSGGWHGFSQKVDPKRDNTPQPPRSK